MTESTTPKTAGRRRGAAVAAGAGVLALAFAGGAGFNALFTDTERADGTVFSAGTLDLSLTGAATYTADVANIAAGDTVYRTIELKNAGTIDFKGIEATITAKGTAGEIRVDEKDPANPKDDVTYGGTALNAGATPLTVKIEACSSAWTTGAAPTCAGTKKDITALTGNVPADGAQTTFKSFNDAPDATKDDMFDLKGSQTPFLGDTQAAESVFLLTTYTLPAAAKNDYQGGSAVLDYTFVATQRDAMTAGTDTSVIPSREATAAAYATPLAGSAAAATTPAAPAPSATTAP